MFTNLGEGAHQLTAVATDNDGETSSIDLNFVVGETTVEPPVELPGANDSPSISFATPTAGSQIAEGSQVSVVVNASDSDGSIDNVRLSVNGSFIRQENRDPYEWDDAALQGLSEGTHTLSAVTTDNDGASATATIAVEVVGDDDPEPPTPTPTPPEPEPEPESQANVFSLDDLREAVRRDNQAIVVAPGNYSIEDLPSDDRYFDISGDDNTIDLAGVYISFPVDATSEAHFVISGSGNTFKNGTFENVYPNGETTITDFVSYNNDRSNLANGNDVPLFCYRLTLLVLIILLTL